MMAGIAFVGVLTANIAAFFIDHEPSRPDTQPVLCTGTAAGNVIPSTQNGEVGGQVPQRSR
jgi:hypothetical protein